MTAKPYSTTELERELSYYRDSQEDDNEPRMLATLLDHARRLAALSPRAAAAGQAPDEPRVGDVWEWSDGVSSARYTVARYDANETLPWRDPSDLGLTLRAPDMPKEQARWRLVSRATPEALGAVGAEPMATAHGPEPEEPRIPWPDPTPEMLATARFNAVWQAIKRWDINVPNAYAGYCGATGNHVRAILDALDPEPAQPSPASAPAAETETRAVLGHTLYRERNAAGGHTYYSDEDGGGVPVWDTALVGAETLRAALDWESGTGYLGFGEPPQPSEASGERGVEAASKAKACETCPIGKGCERAAECQREAESDDHDPLRDLLYALTEALGVEDTEPPTPDDVIEWARALRAKLTACDAQEGASLDALCEALGQVHADGEPLALTWEQAIAAAAQLRAKLTAAEGERDAAIAHVRAVVSAYDDDATSHRISPAHEAERAKVLKETAYAARAFLAAVDGEKTT